MSNKVKISGGEIPQTTKDEIAQKIEMSISDEKQMNRTELNFYIELYEQLQGLNAQVKELFDLITVVSADKMQAYFTEVLERNKAQNVSKGHVHKIRK